MWLDVRERWQGFLWRLAARMLVKEVMTCKQGICSGVANLATPGSTCYECGVVGEFIADHASKQAGLDL